MANGSTLFKSLDETLGALLTEGGLKFDFKVPEKDYEGEDIPEGNVNLHLYQTHENRELRNPAPIIEKSGDMFIRRRPPLRVDCTYMVTAWKKQSLPPDKETDEHELLGQALQWLSRFPVIPSRHLQGDLSQSRFPLPTMIAQQDGLPNIGEFWTALNKPPRASFNLVVTVAMDSGVSRPQGFPVATKTFDDGIKTMDADGNQILVPATEQTTHWQIGGNVIAQPDPNANQVNAGGYLIPGVRLRLVKFGEPESDDDKFATTTHQGRFSFTVRVPGDYSLKVEQAEHFKQPAATTPITVPSIHPASAVPNPYDVANLELVDAKKSITGVVVGVGTGEPIAGVDVILDKTNFDPEPGVEVQDTTNAAGEFTLAGVNFAGRYKLRVEGAAIEDTSINVVLPSDNYVLTVNKT